MLLESEGYLEVETPILNSLAGGALARPFKTKANELDIDLELRIAPELYLKYLIIGGFEKVYEIGKVFRNEGIDTLHNPEFTTLEFYQAYADYTDMMEITENLIRRIVVNLFGSTQVAIPKQEIKSSKDYSSMTQDILEIDFEKEFWAYDVMTEVNNYIGQTIELDDPKLRFKLEGILSEAFPQKFQEQMNEKQLMDKLIEGIIEPKWIQPSYIVNHPWFMSPLAKMHQNRPNLSQRFELFIDGTEIANAYTEQNDYELQK